MPATFTSADLLRVSQLARLELTEEEQKLFARQLADVLAYAAQVQDLDTRGVPPTVHAPGVTTPLRDDVTAESLPQDIVLAQAPEADAASGLFKVPRVLG